MCRFASVGQPVAACKISEGAHRLVRLRMDEAALRSISLRCW
jgi:hypothetical protein